MNVYEVLSRDNYITVNKILMRKLGVECAVLLGELCYRRQYLDRMGKLQEDGFFYATVQSIEDETTLSEHCQRKCLTQLKEMGIVDFERRGIPSKRFIRINQAALEDLLDDNVRNTAAESSGQVPEDFRDLSLKTSALNNNNKNNNNTRISSKDDILDRAEHTPPCRPKTGSLFQSPKKPRKTSVQKINSFITSCEREMNKFDFAEDVRIELMKFFRMLAESNTLLPSASIQEQLRLLRQVREDLRCDVVKNTVSHGWKNLSYQCESVVRQTVPSWDTATAGSFKPKNEEEKTVDIFEGASSEEIF